MKNRKFFLLLLLLSATGFILALLLSHHHRLLTSGGEASFAFCREGCDAVNASSYSEFYGIPVSSYGAVAYAGLLLLALLGLFLTEMSLSLLLLSLSFLISLGCLVVTLFLAGISIFKLSSFCNLCGLTYLVNLVLTGVSGAALKSASGSLFGTVRKSLEEILRSSDRSKEAPGYYQKVTKCLILFILFLHTFSGLTISFFHGNQGGSFEKERNRKFLENYATLQRIPIETSGSPWKGSQAPKVTVVEFSDFACSHCRFASFAFKRLLPEYRKDLKIVYKHQLHDKACNPYAEAFSPKKSCQLAAASVCAQRQGKFWEYHDLLFGPLQTPQTGELVSFARKVGIEEKAFQACMADPGTVETIRRDLEEANRFGIRSTPTLLFNGKMVQGLPPLSLLHALLRREIREKSSR